MQLALILALVTGPAEVITSLPQGDGLPLVHGGFAAPRAWLAVWRGDAWVCWDAPEPRCWQRLELADIVDVASLRAEFVDASTLVLGDGNDPTWWIVRGDPGPRRAAWTATPRETPQPRACGPTGALPIASRERLGFIIRPCPETSSEAFVCVRRARALRLRRPSMLRLRFGLELRARQRWRSREAPDDLTTTGLQLLAVLQIGIDPLRFVAQRRERADLQAQARPSLHALPAPRSRGPLFAAERQALHAAVCGGAP
ncbi:MAG: hypothetical protein H0T76_24595 [Nannocystis sp.]|nr:hypothetical protein [Nannocystis sp.]MBA3549670.1 hypothetical protein [Nannocystis sp.]